MSARGTAAVLLAVGVILTVLAARNPGVVFVDVIAFSARAMALTEGRRSMDGLYPVGYPLVLMVGKMIVGDVLIVAKGVSVLAGVGAVACGIAVTMQRHATAMAGGIVSAWVLSQPGVLQWGTTEGTDLPAAALSLAAIILASQRPALAGALAGAACLCRYTAVAAVPIVLVLARDRRALFTLALTTSPHFLGAAIAGISPLPRQEENIVIANGSPAALLSMETMRRWPVGFARAVATSARDWATWVGAAGLLVGVVRRDKVAFGLVGFAMAHAALLGVAFSNPRLVLPGTLALVLGAAWLTSWRVGSGAVAAATIASFVSHAPAAFAIDKAAAGRALVAAELPAGPWLATSPWLYEQRDGWVIPTIQLSGLGLRRDARAAEIHPAAEREGASGVVLEGSAIRRDYPALASFYEKGEDGFVVVVRRSGYRAYAVR